MSEIFSTLFVSFGHPFWLHPFTLASTGRFRLDGGRWLSIGFRSGEGRRPAFPSNPFLLPTMAKDAAYREAEKKIEAARRLGAKELDLSVKWNEEDESKRLTELPESLGQLTQLQSLDLSRNQLTALPEWLGQLTQLRTLYVHNNQLTALPKSLGQLSHLRVFSIAKNHLTILPPEIGQLTALEELYLHENLIATLPKTMARLQSLRELALLDNRLRSLPKFLLTYRHLQRLYLHDNPALNLSPTILGPDPRHDDRRGSPSARSILHYYFSRQDEETRPLNEVKLILVGRGGAGKTSTVQALQGAPFHEGEESTPGIALCDWTMDGCKGEPVIAHVWDFAGQVITHALHQFFFSVRSIYVVVLTGRENNERDDAEYWLRLIKAFGTDDAGAGPPVVIALNKWDVPGCRPRVDRAVLKERYPFIRGFVEMDCKSRKGIPKLKAMLCQEVSRLKWVREPVNQRWDAVRRALTGNRRRQAHLAYAAYRALCVKHHVPDEEEQDALSEILHNLGVALNYRNDPRLREATVLQPEWLTRNVYALMRRAEKQAGVLKPTDIELVLRKEKDKDMRAYLVRLMERFEIAYVSRAQSPVWLVPQALPDDQPPAAAKFRDLKDVTRLRFTYQALPEGLVSRAIVRLHEFIEEVGGKKQQWASGAVLIRDGARALVRTEPQDRQVVVTVAGPKKARQQLAGLCQAEMRDIHSEIPGLDPLEETEFQGSWIATATLELDEKKGKQTGIATRDQGTVIIDPAEPNNAYSERPARNDELWKPTVFISYSKSNVIQRRRLESELKVLMNEGLLARHWHDRMIDPGDTWDDRIQDELSKADVIIVLTSTEALATDYITQFEIPAAIQLHQSKKAVVVPVILEKCRWAQTSLGDLNALPEKAKPLSNWRKPSDGWSSIADGLAKVFKKLISDGKKR